MKDYIYNLLNDLEEEKAFLVKLNKSPGSFPTYDYSVELEKYTWRIVELSNEDYNDLVNTGFKPFDFEPVFADCYSEDLKEFLLKEVLEDNDGKYENIIVQADSNGYILTIRVYEFGPFFDEDNLTAKIGMRLFCEHEIFDSPDNVNGFELFKWLSENDCVKPYKDWNEETKVLFKLTWG